MSTSETPSPYHHGDLRRALVEAALEALESAGADGVGLREVARTVGVSPSAPYRHFNGKAGLLAAVATEGYHRFRLAQIDARGADDGASLSRMAAAYVNFALGNPRLFRLMFSASPAGADYSELREAAQAAYAPLAEAAAAADPRQPQDLALALWSFVHGLSMLLLERQVAGVGPAAAQDLVDRLTSRFIERLRTG